MAATSFTLAVRGQLSAYMRADSEALPRVHTLTMRAAGGRTKRGIVAQIKSAFAGNGRGEPQRFAKAIKFKSDPPRGFAPDTVVRVYSKARYLAKGRRTSDIDLLEVWSRPETVKAAGHDWLAVPTENAPFRGGRGGGTVHATPRESGLKLVFLRTADPNKAVLVTKARGGMRGVVMYVLLKQVSRSSELDPDSVHAASLERVPDDFRRFWARADSETEARFGRGLTEQVVF